MYYLYTMLYRMENDAERPQDYSTGINFLEQNFSQLPAEGQSQLKKYLQSLVSLQNTMIGTKSVNIIHISSNENSNGK